MGLNRILRTKCPAFAGHFLIFCFILSGAQNRDPQKVDFVVVGFRLQLTGRPEMEVNNRRLLGAHFQSVYHQKRRSKPLSSPSCAPASRFLS